MTAPDDPPSTPPVVGFAGHDAFPCTPASAPSNRDRGPASGIGDRTRATSRPCPIPRGVFGNGSVWGKDAGRNGSPTPAADPEPVDRVGVIEVDASLRSPANRPFLKALKRAALQLRRHSPSLSVPEAAVPVAATSAAARGAVGSGTISVPVRRSRRVSVSAVTCGNPVHGGTNSGRKVATSRTGRRAIRSIVRSKTSRELGSIQWRSSKTIKTGFCRANASAARSRRGRVIEPSSTARMPTLTPPSPPLLRAGVAALAP
jgi:hypothetical protein